MSFIETKNVVIRGLAACVPEQVEENSGLPFYLYGEAEQVIKAIGIERRHIVPRYSGEITATDLGTKAAIKLLEDLNWDKESLDLVAFCTQTPDYKNQPNSFIIHENLDLPQDVFCLDFYHGCTGWVASLASVCSMMQTGSIKRCLLIVGDTVSPWQSLSNRESYPLFGDAVTVTALEYSPEAKPFLFNMGSLGKEGRALISEDGGMRKPITVDRLRYLLDLKAGKISFVEGDSKMDGMDVFAFAITKVPKAIKKLCQEHSIEIENIDKLVLHQANKLIVENVAKRCKVPFEKVPNGLKDYGNTTSASIPMAMITECSDDLKSKPLRILACGFGTGLSWGAVYFETEGVVVSEMQTI